MTPPPPFPIKPELVLWAGRVHARFAKVLGRHAARVLGIERLVGLGRKGLVAKLSHAVVGATPLPPTVHQ